MNTLYCIACPNGCLLTIAGSGVAMIVEGGKCPKGTEFAKAEMTDPTRVLTTTVRTKFPEVPVISVRTDGEIPKEKLMEAMAELNEITVDRELACGDTLVDDIADTEVRVIITSPALMNLGAELENKNTQLSRGDAPGSDDDSHISAADAESLGYSETGYSGQGYTPPGEVLDALGFDAAGGIVGAAGEAVGVEGADDDAEGESGKDSKDSRRRRRQDKRPHI